MSQEALNLLHRLIQESHSLKDTILNLDNPRFQPWLVSSRMVIEQYVAVKQPAFKEILFASDFFLSKSGPEREDINDRIALVSDLELAEKILTEATQILEKDVDKKKRSELKSRCLSQQSLNTNKVAETNFSEWKEFRQWVDSLDLNVLERSELESSLNQIQRALSETPPNWDKLKRGMHFLMDFDRDISLSGIPIMISLYKNDANRGAGSGNG